MSANTNASPDWVGGTRTKLLAWGLPHAALVAGLLVMVPARTAIWIAALAFMTGFWGYLASLPLLGR